MDSRIAKSIALELAGHYAFYNGKVYPVSKFGNKYLIFSQNHDPNFQSRKKPLEGFYTELDFEDIPYGYSVNVEAKYKGVNCSIISQRKNNSVIVRSEELLIENGSVKKDRNSYITEIYLNDEYLTIIPNKGRAFDLRTEEEYRYEEGLKLKER